MKIKLEANNVPAVDDYLVLEHEGRIVKVPCLIQSSVGEAGPDSIEIDIDLENLLTATEGIFYDWYHKTYNEGSVG